MNRLRDHIKTIPARSKSIQKDSLLSKPAPNKWSKQEILGHLVDSAVNNLRRFNEAQFFPTPYSVIGYNQDNLVVVNQYQSLPLNELMHLWAALNGQIVHVVTNIPVEKLQYKVILYSGETKTLEWLIGDYVDHMEHHLNQVFG